MKIAYLILTHKSPDHLEHLIRVLDCKEASFFIHLDEKCGSMFDGVEERLSNKPNVYFLKNRIKVYWGEISIVNATLSLIKQAKSRTDPDYMILLSGDHYPIKSNESILSFLKNKTGFSFMKFWKIPSDSRWMNLRGGLDRIEYYYPSRDDSLRFFIKRMCDYIDTKIGQIGIIIWKISPRTYFILRKRKAPYLFMKKNERINALIKREESKNIGRPKRKFLKGLVPYGGSQWWILSREAITNIFQVLNSRPEILKFFKNTSVPDETFFQTILLNTDQRDKIINDNMLYSVWDKYEMHPIHLKLHDFDRLKKSDSLFARKINVNTDRSLVRSLDSNLLGLKRGLVNRSVLLPREIKTRKLSIFRNIKDFPYTVIGFMVSNYFDKKNKEFMSGFSPKNFPSKDRFEIVVARYKENIGWMWRIRKNITLYSKGKSGFGSIMIPNQGFEAGTYLYHIVTRYDSLADRTLFIQGCPFPHNLQALVKYVREEGGMVANYSISEMSIGKGSDFWWTKKEQKINYNVMLDFLDLIGGSKEGTFKVSWGAQFAVDKSLIRMKPLSYWRRLLDISQMDELVLDGRTFDSKHVAFLFEFFWWKIFNDSIK